MGGIDSIGIWRFGSSNSKWDLKPCVYSIDKSSSRENLYQPLRLSHSHLKMGILHWENSLRGPGKKGVGETGLCKRH